MRFNNLAERKFGKLTAHWPVGKRGEKVIWLCHCECGTMKLASTSDLVTGHYISCGCSKVARFYKHGMTHSREYSSYECAEQRCNNPNTKKYSYYGGRGIEFRFKDFDAFYKELGPRPTDTTLDRINTNGHYEVGNVRWATRAQQLANRRPSKPRCSWSEKERESHRVANLERRLAKERQG